MECTFWTSSQFQQVDAALKAADISVEMGEISQIPQNTVELDSASAGKVLKLMEMLDDHDDS